jgi:hypothetical protein
MKSALAAAELVAAMRSAQKCLSANCYWSSSSPVDEAHAGASSRNSVNT